MTSETWVWIHLPGSTDPVLCGVHRHDGGIGRFVYGRSYLGRQDALPIDPVLLPLQEKEFSTSHLGGWFSVLLDAGPDAWGRRVIDRFSGPQDQRGYLLHAYGERAGALSFSAHRDEPPRAGGHKSIKALGSVIELHSRVESGAVLSRAETLELLKDTGTGGARPKSTIERDGRLWLAKGSSVKDKVDQIPVPVLEGALFKMAGALGIRAPDSEVLDIEGHRVLLIERFDRSLVAGSGDPARFARWRFASGMTLLWSKPEVAQYSFQGSYTNLARRLREWLPSPQEDTRELYRRIVFNALVGNLDDHEKNHGVVALANGNFALSPVFDLTITATAQERLMLAMSFGSSETGGALITLPNLLSESQHFGYGAGEAEDLIRNQWVRIRAELPGLVAACGCDDGRVASTLALMPGRRALSDMAQSLGSQPTNATTASRRRSPR